MDPPPDLRTGALPDPIDTRDRPLYTGDQAQELQTSKVSSSSLVPRNDTYILPDRPPVYHQRSIGSCTANSTCAALRYAYKKSTGQSYDEFQPSRLFTYYVARTLVDPKGTQKALTDEESEKDVGSNNRNAIFSFVLRGILQESIWQYGDPSSDQKTHVFKDLDKFPNPNAATSFIKPRDQLQVSDFIMGLKEKLHIPDNVPVDVGYYRIYDTSASSTAISNDAKPSQTDWDAYWNMPSTLMLEKTIADGFPFIFSIRLYEGMTLTKAANFDQGLLYDAPPLNLNTLKEDGGHSVLAVGYDRSKGKSGAFLIQNSWGEGWGLKEAGLKGCFWLPYEWFTAMHGGWAVTRDFWVIKVTHKS